MASVFVLFLLCTFGTLCGAVNVGNARDDSLSVTEIIEKMNAGESNLMVDGDIVSDNKRNADPCTATGCKWPKLHGKVYIPISIGSEYTIQEKIFLISTLLSFQRDTCVRFVLKQSRHTQFVHFFSGSGCWSYIGMQPHGQLISLRQNGCFYKSVIHHELLHALGFHHEHVRSDRDDHIKIFYENIQEGKEKNFQKRDTNNLKTPYDFDSIMHYDRYTYSKNGGLTMLSKSDPDRMFGYAEEMSANDLARLNKLYECCKRI